MIDQSCTLLWPGATPPTLFAIQPVRICIPALQPGSYGTTGTTGTTGYGTTAATGTTGYGTTGVTDYGTTVGGEDVIERRTEEAAYEEAATTGRPAVAQTVTTAEAAPARAAPVSAGTEAVSPARAAYNCSLMLGFAAGEGAAGSGTQPGSRLCNGGPFASHTGSL